MNDHIPTIEELLRLPKCELDAIFRRSAGVASDATKEPQARAAAAKTVKNVQRSYTLRPPAP